MKITQHIEMSRQSIELADNNSIKKSIELKDVAEKFEAYFIEKMLEKGRNSIFKDNLFSNKGTDEFKSLLDQKYANIAAKQSDFGIANALISQYKNLIKSK